MAAAFTLGIAVLIMIGTLAWLVGAQIRSIVREEGSRGFHRIWKDFGLSVGFAVLFFASWIGQAIVEWQVFVDQQKAHGDPTRVVDFIQAFSQSSLENWQSEFLQLFSFTVMAALLIHKGSAESRDSGDEIKRTLDRLERKLDEMSRS